MDGLTLIEMGYEPGKHFSEMIAVGRTLQENDVPLAQLVKALDEIYAEATFVRDTIPLQSGAPCELFIDVPDSGYERENYGAVVDTMAEVVKTPTVVKAYVMPDACPAGPIGTIPVGGVVTTRNAIHPGMHSADICCSMFLTTFDENRSTDKVLDAVQKQSHFGYGGRADADDLIMSGMPGNRFLDNKQMYKVMGEHLGTQGDGNHFFFVGKRKSDGKLTFVTHHGSRKPGALLYKAGMKVAEQFRREISPDTLKQNAWIPFDTDEGREYWEALQIIRDWTKLNHIYIHNSVMNELDLDLENTVDRFWNEHNFVFKKDDLFHHAKGSTPVWGSHAADADPQGRTIIPLNMGAPILIVKNHPMNKHGFAPHGAGRNMSRTKYNKLNAHKTVEQIMKDEVGHIDARFYCGVPDPSELPGAYKNSNDIYRQIADYKLAKVVDEILPLGSMMAGDQPKPWLNKKKK